ncbi:MAG TPA: PEP-CTERM sorting domain-containing protein [Bryobacteraceae bacterium]|nr:PEP-CTERM sorting domain-containing protein [Bryobacteraceae bacterium]
MRALIPILLVFAAAANADELSVNLDSSTQTGVPGEMLTFYGTLANNTGGTLFITSDSFLFDINGAVDDSPFLNNAPISIDGGDTSADFAMFNINIPSGQASGTYHGSFTVAQGSGGSDPIGTADFEVDVTAATVPEPASYMLLASTLVLLGGWRGVRSKLQRP